MKTEIPQRAEIGVATEDRTLPLALWRVAGGLAIVHVVLMMAGFSLQKSTMLSDSGDEVLSTFSSANIPVVLGGILIEGSSFLVLLPVITFLARALGQRTEVGRWAAQTGMATGVVYVAVTLAIGFPPLAAALFASQHGVVDGAVLAMIGNLRNFGYYLTLLVLGFHAICIGASTRGESVRLRRVGWGGIGVGALLVVSVLTQGFIGFADVSTLVWMLWWICLGVALIRTPGRTGKPRGGN
jgi:hypothetical protein